MAVSDDKIRRIIPRPLDCIRLVFADPDMSLHERSIMIVLIAHMDNEELTSYPGIELIARHLNVCERTVKRYLAKLVAAQRIAIEAHHGRGVRTRYKLIMFLPSESPNQVGQGLEDGQAPSHKKEVTTAPTAVTSQAPFNTLRTSGWVPPKRLTYERLNTAPRQPARVSGRNSSTKENSTDEKASQEKSGDSADDQDAPGQQERRPGDVGETGGGLVPIGQGMKEALARLKAKREQQK